MKHAAATPDGPQPYAELGLKADEYARIREILGRRPTTRELAMYSVMWSEHCSYKSSKVHLRQFGEKAPPSRRPAGRHRRERRRRRRRPRLAVTFKIESHNHPSYVEPYQGAATGVGGIVRDILTMGARPVAVMDPLRFGPADAADTRRVLPGVVAASAGYGNCLGLPNIGGELVFDPSYLGNPLVNALCVGVMRHDDLKLATAAGPGQPGHPVRRQDRAATASAACRCWPPRRSTSRRRPEQAPERAGRRPVHREAADRVLPGALRAPASSPASRTSAAPGISCATSELAAAGDGRHARRLDRVPLRDSRSRPRRSS